MRKLLLLLLFTSSISQGQNVYFSVGADVRNGIIGSAPTNDQAELDLMLKFGMVSNKGVEIVTSYESFNRIDFQKFTFGVGYQIPIIDRIGLIPTLEYGLIIRSDNWGGGLGNREQSSCHLVPSISLPIRFDINNNIALELQPNLTQRTDINTMYGGNNLVFSNYVNFIYKIGVKCNSVNKKNTNNYEIKN